MKSVIIIGGGIAGTTCAEYISSLSDNIKVTIVAANDVVKTAVTARRLTRILNEVHAKESDIESFENQYENVSVIIDFAPEIYPQEKIIKLSSNRKLAYDKLCICTGAKPKIQPEGNPYVLYIRDTDTVKLLQDRLSSAKKIIVIGNGGIALELVHEVRKCEIIWCVKDDYIGNTFFDQGASEFFLSSFENEEQSQKLNKSEQTVFCRRVYEIGKEFVKGCVDSGYVGCALGPDWSKQQQLFGCLNSPKTSCNVKIKYNCEPIRIFSESEKNTEELKENVYVELSTKEKIGADFIVYATGVLPNISSKVFGEETLKITEFGICVDESMRTNIQDVYAAGDVCDVAWKSTQEGWFQMKLWTQAWQLGAYAGKCIVKHFKGEQLPLDFCFELFTHATTFFGYKVCLLGCYNCQNLDKSKCEMLVRITKGQEYIKIILVDGRVKGATLIGETDLEETFENLILNQIDVGFLGESLIDPNVDIEDYFD